jgi:heme/copper-type cytochrome/quinol oxidase subunit 2
MRGMATVAVLALLLAGCSSGIGRPVHEVRAEPGGDGVQRVEVTAHAFYFDPNRIVLKANVPVELKVKNASAFVPHNFSCAAPQAGIQVDEGLGLLWDGETAHFTPTSPGEYPFFCKVDGHSKKGMTGTLVVVP